MKYNFLILLVIFISSCAQKQKGHFCSHGQEIEKAHKIKIIKSKPNKSEVYIKGVIHDKRMKEPIYNALVRISSQDGNSTEEYPWLTDENGSFELKIKARKFKLLITKDGYYAFEKIFDLKKFRTLTLKVRLEF